MSNHLTVIGNIVRDPDLRFTASGSARVALSVASTRRFRPKGATEFTDSTSYFSVITWGDLAEHVAESLLKGDRVTVSGRVEQRTWIDEDGQRQSSFEIVADDVAASLRFRGVKIERPARTGGEGSPADLPVVAPVPVDDAADMSSSRGSFDHPGEDEFDQCGELAAASQDAVAVG